MTAKDRRPRGFQLGTTVAILISILALFAAFWQGFLMRKAMRVDQRAWVSVLLPTNFPLNETSIPIVTQIANGGKTPAKQVEGDIVATVMSKGEAPTLGNFSIGHPHNRLYAGGTIFPGSPIPTTVTVIHYGPKMPEAIVPDDNLRQDIANGNRFIIFYGRITYYDVFGIRHWTQFCTGTGIGILENLKQCLNYNDVDDNEE